MSEFTAFAASPIPPEPSQESVKLLNRMKGARKGMSKIYPDKMSLHLYRLMINAVGLTARAPKGGYVKKIRLDNGERGRIVAGPDADQANGMLMWVHGGGLVSGSPQIEQGIATAYAEQARIPVFLPKYRLAPEHVFPAAADDVLAGYKYLLAQGIPADKIRLGGSSAGGSLVIGLLGDLRREGLPMPGAVVLDSPMIQLSAEAATARDLRQPDPGTAPEFILRTNLAYADGTPFSHPRLDHLANDMTGWPPILVQTSDLECIMADAELLREAMLAAGGRCEVQAWPGQVHCFPALGYRSVPESKIAVEYGARFLANLEVPAQ
ncbi:MAG TPA: alpha/beta hydrolase fold domain-containing protein [Pseudonocardiaceae bacterium]|jgi:acetyl esterase/lipase|nr:alpha/beta hydrolase fold domain-containing protein [Pseudonocardiaceae bacterium]